MSLISKIKVNYLEKKIKDSKAAHLDSNGKVPVSQLPFENKLHVGKIDTNKFYAIAYAINETTGVITGSTYDTKETAGKADHFYLSIPTMQIYRFNPVNSTFVAIAAADPA